MPSFRPTHSPFAKKRRTFESLPKHRRREEVIRLKNRIRQDAALFGGRFVSRTLLDAGRTAQDSQACICFFPGHQPDVLWNALVRTAREAFWDAVSKQAFEQADALLDTAGEPKEPLDLKAMFEPLPTGGFQLRPPARYAAFEGMTLSEKVEALSQQIIAECPPQVSEAFTVKRGFVYGTGLEVVVDVDVIDQQVIEQVIERFQALGEQDWQAAEPVPESRLPSTTWAQMLKGAPVC